MGPVSDRVGRRAALVAGTTLQAVAFLAFSAVQGLDGLVLTAAAFGFSYGTISALFPAIVGDFFGPDQAGTLVGFLFMLGGSIAAWGSLAAWLVYDGTRGYRPGFQEAVPADRGAGVP